MSNFSGGPLPLTQTSRYQRSPLKLIRFLPRELPEAGGSGRTREVHRQRSPSGGSGRRGRRLVVGPREDRLVPVESRRCGCPQRCRSCDHRVARERHYLPTVRRRSSSGCPSSSTSSWRSKSSRIVVRLHHQRVRLLLGPQQPVSGCPTAPHSDLAQHLAEQLHQSCSHYH